MAAQELAPLGWLDAGFAAVVLLSAVVGLWRGVVYELLSLAGWLVAWLGAQMFGAEMGALLLGQHWGEAARDTLGWAVCFVLTLMVWRILTWLVKLMLQASPLAPVDRGLGAVFGALRGLLLLMVLVMLVGMTPLKDKNVWRQAPSVAWTGMLLDVIAPVLPGNWWRGRPAAV